MKPQNLHAHEDRLLDFAYGELPAQEARAVETHLQGCTRCTELLDGIRGVRSTMAQLTLEPAPDAGLESLMAYAQQAARNAAAGPALKPTWWRRWLIPAMGVTAVSVFGIISLQVSKSVDLAPQLTTTAQRESKAEAASVAATPPATAAPMMNAEPPAPPAEEAAQLAGITPPPPEPAAKFDGTALEKAKAPPRKKAMAMKPSPYDANSDWSNAGVGASRALERDSIKEESQKANKDYAYDRRDAMTQSGAFSKPKPILAGTGNAAPATPAPAPAQAAPPPPVAAQPAAPADEEMNEGADMDDAYAASEAQVQQQGPSSKGLRLSESKRGSSAPAADKEAEAAEVASLDLARNAPAPREQRTRAPQASAPSAAPGAGMPSGRTERRAASPAELSKRADEARRQRNRVLEAQYLRLALDAAVGKDRLDLLNRLCDAEFSIGRPQAANEACTQVIDEAPSSSAARMARSRLSKEFGDAKPDSRLSAPKSSSPLKADDMESVPAQTQ